jgi:chromosome segregation protein
MWDGRDRDSVQSVQFLENEVELLKGRVERRDNTLEEVELEILELRGEVDELRGRVGRRNDRLQEEEGEVGDLQLQVQEQDDELNDQFKRIQEQDLELAEMRREQQGHWEMEELGRVGFQRTERLLDERDIQTARIREQDAELVELRLALATAERRVASSATFIAAQDAAAEQLKGMNTSLHRHLEEGHEEREDMRQRLEEHEGTDSGSESEGIADGEVETIDDGTGDRAGAGAEVEAERL